MKLEEEKKRREEELEKRMHEMAQAGEQAEEMQKKIEKDRAEFEEKMKKEKERLEREALEAQEQLEEQQRRLLNDEQRQQQFKEVGMLLQDMVPIRLPQPTNRPHRHHWTHPNHRCRCNTTRVHSVQDQSTAQ